VNGGRLAGRVLTLEAGRQTTASGNGLASSGFPFVDAGLAAIRAAFDAHRTEPTLARIVAAAFADLAAPLLRRPPRASHFAADLHRTDLFPELVATMARDPERCIRAYNAAVARHPAAGMRPLAADPIQDRWELPLWRLPKGEPRRHVYAEDLSSIPIDELAPKALFMTGLMRLAGCDLMIHGMGGAGPDEGGHEGYDRITDEWLRDWLGEQSIAPIVLVTATLRLPLLSSEPPTADQVARATWLAHHARHNPDVLRDTYAADAKAKLVARITQDDRPHRHDDFRRMHDLLDRYRTDHAPDLADLDRRAQDARARLADAAIAMDRTWPFPLQPAAALRELQSRIAAAFATA
jgi:hypothetical protein